MSKANVYTVNQRIQDLQARVLSLETANKNLLAFVESELQTRINDARNILRGQIRDGIDGVDGAPGRDGVDGQSIVGPRGEQGGVLVVGETELAQAVIAQRIQLKEQHAAHIAVLVEHIEGQKKGTWVGQHFAKLLENIRQEIEALR
jgi:hypothetical protein